jgi:2'-5' RNA ligase
VRLFLAINFPASLREAMHEATTPLREAAPGVGWTRPEALHLTTKFLGECAEEVVGPLTAGLAQSVARHQSVPVVVGGIGAFPNFRRPRVVWMGIDGRGGLELLQHDVELACAKLGFEPEGRPFRPHVTLGRVRERSGEGEARELARVARTVVFRENALVTSVDLMVSQLSRGGSRYTLLASAPLEGT